MKIGWLALRTGTPVDTIRYYEREGLLPVTARTEGNYRIYDESHVERLSFVRHCRSLDMTLDEIRVLLHFKDSSADNCAAVNELLDEHIGHVAERMRGLKQLEKQLKSLRTQCQNAQDAAHCGILTGLSDMARQQPALKPGSAGHVHGAHHGGVSAHAVRKDGDTSR
jgi:Cd(II)/Pb(II)-responsive transcriptional regulator